MAIKEPLDMAFIRSSFKPFASLLVLAKKRDNTIRMCIDYRALTKKTIKNNYHIPSINELIDELHGALRFSKIDLSLGYHPIHLRDKDVENTNF